MRLLLRTAGALVLVAGLAACGQTVDEDDLVDQVSAAVEDASGTAPDGVECPEDLDAEEGASTTCAVSVGDATYATDVEVTGVDDGTAQFDVEVPDDLRVPMVAASDVEEQVSTQLEAQVGIAPDEVACPEDLPGDVGALVTCTLLSEDEEYDVAVEVTEVDGRNVDFSIEVADEPNP